MSAERSEAAGAAGNAGPTAQLTALCVIGTLAPVGGAERAFRAITTGLHRESGLQIRYCAQIPSDPETDGDATILRPGHEPPSFKMVLRLRRCIQALPPHAIVFSFQIHANILASAANWMLPRRARRPVVINDRSNIVVKTSAPANADLRRRARAILIRLATHFTYRRATRIVCNSEQNAELIAEFLGRRHPPITTIYNPLDAEGIASRFPARDRSVLIDPSAPLVVAHGRLVDGKGWRTLIRAFAGVRTEIPMARLRILGAGPLEAKLRQLVHALGLGEAVELPGHRSDPLPQIECGDVYVLASEAEGLPNCLLEAIALGLPSISTDCPTGPAEILGEEGQYGLLVPVGDSDSLRSAIVRLLEDADERARLSRSARSRAADFSLDRALDSYSRLLEQAGPA